MTEQKDARFTVEKYMVLRPETLNMLAQNPDKFFTISVGFDQETEKILFKLEEETTNNGN